MLQITTAFFYKLLQVLQITTKLLQITTEHTPIPCACGQ